MPTDSNAPVVALLGLGRLGKRYLEGLSRVPHGLAIWAIDPDAQALQAAQQVAAVHKSAGWSHRVQFCTDFNTLPATVDLLISSTTAKHRAASLSSALNRTDVKAVLLEKILAPSLEELSEIEGLIEPIRHRWVNHPRRLSGSWHRLKEQYRQRAPVSMAVWGKNWGLCTSSLHFIDLMQWFTGETVVSIDPVGGPLIWRGAKRQGFKEFSGRLNVRFSRGSTLLLQDDSEHNDEDSHYSIGILAGSQRMRVELVEVEGPTLPQPREDRTRILRLPRLSDYVPEVVAGILSRGSTDLPTVDETLHANRVFLVALLRDIARGGDPIRQLSIT